MKRLLSLVALMLCATSPIFARQKLQGYCEQGGKTVVTSGLTSTTNVQQSFPSCTVNVYVASTVTPATIYSDNNGTVKGNPLTADANGYWFAYADNGRYDIRKSGGGILTPFTEGDYLLDDNAEQTFVVNPMSFTATPTFDASLFSIFQMTLTANVTSSTATNSKTGRVIGFQLCQDGVGGRTFAWPGTFDSAPTIDSRASKCSTSLWEYNGSTWKRFSSGGDALSLAANAIIYNGAAALTLPTASDTLVGRATVDTLSGKTISAAGLPILGATSGTTTLVAVGVASGTLTLPAATDTLVGRATADTLSNKILASPTLTNATINTATLTNPTLSAALFLAGGMTLNGSASGQTILIPSSVAAGTLTLPAATDTLVAQSTTDTLNNKTLAAPVITGGMTLSGATSGSTVLLPSAIASGTLTLPAVTDTLVARTTTDSLFNKSFTGALSGNNVNLLNSQGVAANIVGTGTPNVVYTYTLPANTVAVGKGIRISVGANQSAVATTWALTINGQNIDSRTLSSGNDDWSFLVRAESLTGGAAYGKVCSVTTCTASGTSVPSLAWNSDQVIRITASNAGPNVVTPVIWFVELVQ